VNYHLQSDSFCWEDVGVLIRGSLLLFHSANNIKCICFIPDGESTHFSVIVDEDKRTVWLQLGLV